MATKPDYMTQEQWDALDDAAKERVGAHVAAGGSNVWKRGDRISKTAWDAMSQGERDAIGLSNFSDFQNAARGYRSRWHEGGDLYEQREARSQAAVDAGLGNASNWADIAGILQGAGIREDSPFFKQLRMTYEGNADPTGTWHRGGGGWINVATSDLAAKDRPVANPGVNTGGGIQAVLEGMYTPRMAFGDRLNEWFNQGTSTMEGRTDEGGWYNRRPNGATEYFDRYGRAVQGGTPSAPAPAQVSGRPAQFDYNSMGPWRVFGNWQPQGNQGVPGGGFRWDPSVMGNQNNNPFAALGQLQPRMAQQYQPLVQQLSGRYQPFRTAFNNSQWGNYRPTA